MLGLQRRARYLLHLIAVEGLESNVLFERRCAGTSYRTWECVGTALLLEGRSKMNRLFR